VHCDAVQAAGKLAIDIDALGVDFLTLSAHKFGGPQGVGALVVAKGLEPEALLRGGGQERRWRPGTENLPGIAGFGRACELAMADADRWQRTTALRDRLEARLMRLAPAARVFGRDAERLPNTSCTTMPGVSNQTQLIEFDLAGIAVSTGSACSSGKVGPSHVLAAMGVEPATAASAIRISLGWASTADDVDHLVDAWGRLYARTRPPVTDTLARPA
jgi:cysteine desulfurase